VFAAAFKKISKDNVVFLLPRKDDKSNAPVYTGETMGDAEHDLNAVAARLGYSSFDEAAAVLTAGKKPRRALSSDPLSRARRIVKSFDRRRAKNRNLRQTPDEAAARSLPGSAPPHLVEQAAAVILLLILCLLILIIILFYLNQ
jgi:hypothetical protein